MRRREVGTVEAFDRRQILEKFHRVEIGINSEILREVSEHVAQGVRVRGHVSSVPRDLAFRRSRDGREDAHQRSFARAVRPEQSQHSGPQFQAESAQGPGIRTVTLADIVDEELQSSLRVNRINVSESAEVSGM